MIVIDGKEYTFSPGEMILQVARRNGIDIPTLCYLKGATPTGACRICVVEVKGARSLVASCAAPAAPGMVVRTQTPQVMVARRLNLELLLASGRHNCLVQDLDVDSWTDFQLKAMALEARQELCPVYGECRLQDLAIKYQVRGCRFEPVEPRHKIENVNPYIVRDLSRCILCGRCVQACNEIQVNNAISYGYRGTRSKIVARGDRPLKDSDCVFCGECVQACPVGALILTQDLESRDRLKGESKPVPTTCGHCGVGCQMYLHVRKGRIVRVTGVEELEPNKGSLCVKGRFGYSHVHDPERLRSPLIRKNGALQEATWDEAFLTVAGKIQRLQKEHGPDAMAVLGSSRLTNEENYLIQKFTRTVIGTNNVDHVGRLCSGPSLDGLGAAFGSAAMTNPIADIEKAEVILITGSNTTENHPVLSTYVKRAVTRKGAKLIVVDPRRVPIVTFATTWLRQNPGTDAAWVSGMIHVIIKERLFNEPYVMSRTVGIEDLKKAVEKYTPEHTESVTGIPREELIQSARLYARAKTASILYADGFTQQTGGTENVKALANLAMLCGHVGVEGGGVNPLQAYNNGQGACDMGVLPTAFTGYQRVADAALRDRMAKAWGARSLPEKPGLNVMEMLDAARTGKLKGLYIIGENPIFSEHGLKQVRESLEKLDLLVVQDMFLGEAAKSAHVVLPSASFAEKEGTFTNSERRVQRVRKAVATPGDAREDWRILCDLSYRMGHHMKYENAQAIMTEISQVTPCYTGISYQRLEREGIPWPCTSIDHPGTPCLHKKEFTCGRGVFQAVKWVPPAELPDKDYPMVLSYGRVSCRLRGGGIPMEREGAKSFDQECFLEISVGDARKYGLRDSERVKIISRRGEMEAKAKLSDRAVDGTVFVFSGGVESASVPPGSAGWAVRIEKAQ